MATMHMNDAALRVCFTRREKIGGLLRDVDVPLTAIKSVTVEPDGLKAARGVRAPGLSVPGRRKVGTWRGRGHRSVVSVRRDQPAVRLRLDGHRFSELLIGAADAEAIATQLRAVIASRG
jgi:hypothetical protein